MSNSDHSDHLEATNMMVKIGEDREGDDLVVTYEDDCDHSLSRHRFTLDEMASLQRGEPVARYGSPEIWSAGEQLAAHQARLDQIDAELGDLERADPRFGDR
jgi:hypothetical protein